MVYVPFLSLFGYVFKYLKVGKYIPFNYQNVLVKKSPFNINSASWGKWAPTYAICIVVYLAPVLKPKEEISTRGYEAGGLTPMAFIDASF